MTRKFSRAASTIVLAVGLAACGQAWPDSRQDREAPGSGNSTAGHSAPDMKMHEAMASAVGADVSDTWVRKMIAHHEGAVEMTDAILARGGDPRVAAMARAMGAQQRREIEEMRRLIRAGAAPDPASARPYLAGEKRMHDSMMAAKGGDPSHDFLLQMIAHHEGALAMSQVVLDQGRDPRVAAIARRIVADQSREIAQMRTLLAGMARTS